MSLSSQLRDPSSPVRKFFLVRVGDVRSIRREWRSALAGAETIRPITKQRPPYHTLGTALDYRIRFYFPSPPVASLIGARAADYVRYDKIADLLRAHTQAAEEFVSRHVRPGVKLTPTRERDLVRHCYVLALGEEIYRAGAGIDSPLYRASPRRGVGGLMSLVPDFAVDDLFALSRLFVKSQSALIGKPAELNPSFIGSPVVNGADADLIVDGCLIDIKTTVSPRSLKVASIFQLAAYAMLDFVDEFGIDAVAFYMARQGVLVRFEVGEFFRMLTGERDVSLKTLRYDFSVALLGGPKRPRQRVSDIATAGPIVKKRSR